MRALLGVHRPPPDQLPTAEERAAVHADTVTSFLLRWVGPISRVYPGTTLVTLRELSLRDIAGLLYWRAEHLKPDDEQGEDLHDELFGEVR